VTASDSGAIDLIEALGREPLASPRPLGGRQLDPGLPGLRDYSPQAQQIA